MSGTLHAAASAAATRRQEVQASTDGVDAALLQNRNALLSEPKTAQWLGQSTRTLQRWRLDGSRDPLPFILLGRCVRYRVGDVLDWLDRQTFRSTSAATVARTRNSAA